MFSYGMCEPPDLLCKLIEDWKETSSSGRYMNKDVQVLPETDVSVTSHQKPASCMKTPIWQRTIAFAYQTIKYCVNKEYNLPGNNISLYQAALHRAASKDYFTIVSLLLSMGDTDTQKKWVDEESAIKNGHTEIVKYILAHLDYYPINADLLNASEYGHTEIVKLLLDKCAKPYEGEVPSDVDWDLQPIWPMSRQFTPPQRKHILLLLFALIHGSIRRAH